jgi:hypothetical protein
MKKITYKIVRLLKLPLLCCSGCMAENCEHRINNFQAPCISWRKYSDHPNGVMLDAFFDEMVGEDK